jgi:hypothetical protein
MTTTIEWVTAPSAPTSFALTSVTDTSATFSWSAPADTGGTPTAGDNQLAITGYRILYRTSTENGWTSSGKLSTATTATISGLMPGATYKFLVAATNAVTDSYQNSGPWFGFSPYGFSDRPTGTNSLEVEATTTGGGNRIWDGTSFVVRKPKMWNGSSFVAIIPKMWNGSSWINTN